ncbi:MAG: TonB-dependent receptor [Nitrospinae bacterium]|nr:TonB-dependent receptor [Nitrospinota bacterium]
MIHIRFFRKIFFILILSVSILQGSKPVFSEELEKKPKGPKEHSIIHMDEVIISTLMEEKISSSAKPVTVLNDDNLRMKAGSTIGETLQNEMGVHGQSFGPSVGLPVIRGQDGPRVRVLNNGLGTNDASQNSPDHASTAVPLTAERIEILRGPATLLYGSGAIGGVVNVIDNRIPEYVPDQLVGGSVEQKYNSVSNNRSTAVKIEGGKNKFAYHFDGYYQKSDDIKIRGDAIDATRAQVSQNGLVVAENSNGFIDNTEADNLSGTAGFSFVGDSGFLGFSGNVLDMEYQVPPNGTAGGEKIFIELEQRKLDFKSEWNNPEGFIEAVKTKLSFTDYEHTESLKGFFQNDTFESRVETPHKPILGMKGVAGFQIMTSRFSALDIPTGTFLNPITRTNSYAAFIQEEFDVGSTVAQFGLRIEHTVLNSELRVNPDANFTPISVSVSDLWNIDDQSSINVAFTRSQRAPMVQELFFSGGHDATASFERGNPNLKVETSYNIDLGYKLNSEKVVAEINLFHNWANDYIFRQRTGATVNGDPEVIYQQATATFIGYEAQFIFHVWENALQDVDLTLFSDYTRAQLNNEGDVPRIPPLRWGFQVDHQYENWSSNLRLTRAERQEYSGVNEASTPGYVLLNLNTHYHIDKFNNTDIVVYAKGNNLLNQNIRNSASFLRNFAPEPGVGGEIGIRIDY